MTTPSKGRRTGYGFRVHALTPRTGIHGQPLKPEWREVYFSENESEAREAWSEMNDRGETRYRFGRGWRRRGNV